jgi:ATP-dependent helicase/nuclease subunit A
VKESDGKLDEAFKNNNFSSLGFVKKINEIKNKYETLRLTEIVDLINKTFDVFNKLKDSIEVSSNLDKLSSIYDLANNMDLLKYSPNDFVEYLDILQEEKEKLELSEPKEANNTIRIMTIHSSKGLEFKNVYCINLSSGFNISDSSNATSFNYKHGFALGKNGKKSFMNNYLINEELPLTKSEELRLLYVAITRAISTCYIIYHDNVELSTPLKYDELESIHSFLYRIYTAQRAG